MLNIVEETFFNIIQKLKSKLLPAINIEKKFK